MDYAMPVAPLSPPDSWWGFDDTPTDDALAAVLTPEDDSDRDHGSPFESAFFL